MMPFYLVIALDYALYYNFYIPSYPSIGPMLHTSQLMSYLIIFVYKFTFENIVCIYCQFILFFQLNYNSFVCERKGSFFHRKFPGSGFTRPGLRIDNSIPTGETSHRPGSARHGVPVADPFQDQDLLQPQGVLTLVWRYSSIGPNHNSV